MRGFPLFGRVGLYKGSSWSAFGLDLVLATEFLDVDGFDHLVAAQDGLLGVGLTRAEFTHDAGLLKLSLEFFKSSFDVLSFFDRNYDHF